MDNNKSEQEKIVYKDFDKHWRGLKNYNIISKLNMYLIDRQAIKTLLDISPRTILDVGCGIGRTMSKFKELGFKVIGVDNSETSIDFCQKKGLEAILMDASNMNFQDNSFDVVFAEGLLEHFENYGPLVKEMIRVSKKHILLVQPNCHSLCGKILNIAIETLTKGNIKEIPYRMEEYIESFRKYGCKLILRRPALFNSFAILLFQKYE
ncbi:MAG: class I SAM-dependent methyltransferase [Patescibacteria group bacterium]